MIIKSVHRKTSAQWGFSLSDATGADWEGEDTIESAAGPYLRLCTLKKFLELLFNWNFDSHYRLIFYIVDTEKFPALNLWF